MYKKTSPEILFGVFAIFCCFGLLHLSLIERMNSAEQIINSFVISPLHSYLRSEYGSFFIGILESENKLEFYSPRATWQLQRDEIQPIFYTYRITNLCEEIFPPSGIREDLVLFISESVLSALKDPIVVGNYQNQAYSLYIFDKEEKLTNISETMRSSSNRVCSSLGTEFRATTIHEINGLCYLDETFQLPQEFNSREFSNAGIYSRIFEYLEEPNVYIQNIVEVSHDYFEYAYIFNFNVSAIDNADFYCFIGFIKLESKIPYYPWVVYDTFEEIDLGRKYYNYQYFLIFPRYESFGRGERNSLPLLYNVNKQVIEEMISSIAIEPWE